ncbi:MAG: S-adenosylmethionine:tRNA ribosyltransferase-isomerase, partial [Bacteroidales bacterium]|nr:S-adenosylmethionine:tRNA ribosyltransferase-isomerase [Bacteroidales bacterium]
GPHDEFIRVLYGLGETPIPPQLKELRDVVDEPTEEDPFTDRERYQTVFAKNEGGVVAPSAALHFSRELMKRMEIKGVDFDFITVHSNCGNYSEIDVEDLTKHKMNSEQAIISAEVAERVNRVKEEGRRICAVDTSVMRAIESSVSTTGQLKPFDGWTNKFIFPPYEFSIANCMVANFYDPYSTLLMMTAAFGGYDLVMEGYKTALKEGYMFGPYGDAMLILPD